jgi:hypothetical protein
MQLLFAYDEWCFVKLEAMLVWLEEWFSLSQKMVEELLIVIYLFLTTICSSGNRIFQGLFFVIILAAMMWLLHLRQPFLRTMSRVSAVSVLLRLLFQVWAAGIIFLTLWKPPHRVEDIESAIAQIIYVVFFYVVDICSKGKKGRRRKMALSELKKLFGTIWIPKPIPVPE